MAWKRRGYKPRFDPPPPPKLFPYEVIEGPIPSESIGDYVTGEEGRRDRDNATLEYTCIHKEHGGLYLRVATVMGWKLYLARRKET